MHGNGRLLSQTWQLSISSKGLLGATVQYHRVLRLCFIKRIWEVAYSVLAQEADNYDESSIRSFLQGSAQY